MSLHVFFLLVFHDYECIITLPVTVIFFSQSKLTEGLSLAKEFHSNVQEILTKMSKCEESFGFLPAPSFVLDTVCTQLQDHRVGL